VHVREQGQQAEHGYNFELKFMGAVCHPLRQRMQPQKDQTESDKRDDQEYSGTYKEWIRSVLARYEKRQVMGR
jgi:hypothetical protein